MKFCQFSELIVHQFKISDFFLSKRIRPVASVKNKSLTFLIAEKRFYDNNSLWRFFCSDQLASNLVLSA